MKTIAINGLLLFALLVLLYMCTNEAFANLDKGNYRPTADEIASQCEQIRYNDKQLNKCLAALKNARN